MKWLIPLSLALSIPTLAVADGLDEAVSLVLSANPVLVAEQAEFTETTRQRSWSTDLTLSYTEQGTDYGGPGGANAGIRVSIPLFDRKHELDTARASTGLQQARDRVLAAFLADVERLGTQAAKVRELETMRRFYRDRLEYRKQQVDEGIAEADELWPAAEKMQQVEFDYRAELGKLETMRERIAREYGGEQWTRLRDLLAAQTSL